MWWFTFLTKSGAGALTAKQLVDVPTGHATSGIDPSAWGSLLTFPDFAAIGDGAVWILGATIAVVASLKTFLCVEATNKHLTPNNGSPHKPRVARPRRRQHRQWTHWRSTHHPGHRAFFCKHQTGNATKMSAILHGAWLMVFSLLAPALLTYIPLGSLAARVLFVVGYKLAKPANFKKMFDSGMAVFIPFVVTILAIVFIDLLKGLGIGLVVASSPPECSLPNPKVVKGVGQALALG